MKGISIYMNDDNIQSHLSGQQDSPRDDLGFDEIPLDIQNPRMTNLQKRVLSLPPEANDTDLIEKEWVLVLQEIVSHTFEDPYTQQNEISRIKADYMKKRYNKDIKQGDA